MASVTPLRLLAFALVLTGVIALSAPSPAIAAKPCWKQIVDDWYDNERIDSSYSQKCYAQAEDKIGQDLRDYSDLPGEIARARARDLRDQPNDPGKAGRTLAGSGPVEARDNNGEKAGGPINEFLDAAGPSSADSAPIPLLVLAGLALMLVAAGAVGVFSRKLSARRARVTPPVDPTA